MARWRREPKWTGLRSTFQGLRGYELREGEETIIHVAASTHLNDRLTAECWYWYGLGRNTAREGLVFKTAEDAKEDAMREFKRLAALRVSTPGPEAAKERA